MKQTMDDCIRETPEIIRKNTADRVRLTSQLVSIYQKSKAEKIIVVASGSSYNAAACARFFMQKVLKKEVQVIPPYTFTYWENDFSEKAFVVVASQSGNSTNSLRALEKLREKKHLAIGITADNESDFKTYCDVLINYEIGLETVGFVTKGMVGLVLFFMLFALEAARTVNTIEMNEYKEYVKKLEETADIHRLMYQRTKAFFEENKRELLSTEKVFLVGSGPGYGVALEGALKIGETLGICSVAYESEEFLHGPNFQVNDNYTCIFIDNNDVTSERMHMIYEAASQFTNRCYMITASQEQNGKFIKNPQSGNPYISVLYNLAAVEYIAYRVTNDLNRWPVEELAEAFDRKVRIKSK
ncbi:glutamine--fructose-6-phosphate aminotransferase [isomerizing] [Lachnospiraceae bacterium]|nr:glutamine--fructose-6-phosphate aminotransferase [isomerizing] [Lachnospiraceae bacterium]